MREGSECATRSLSIFYGVWGERTSDAIDYTAATNQRPPYRRGAVVHTPQFDASPQAAPPLPPPPSVFRGTPPKQPHHLVGRRVAERGGFRLAISPCWIVGLESAQCGISLRNKPVSSAKTHERRAHSMGSQPAAE